MDRARRAQRRSPGTRGRSSSSSRSSRRCARRRRWRRAGPRSGRSTSTSRTTASSTPRSPRWASRRTTAPGTSGSHPDAGIWIARVLLALPAHLFFACALGLRARAREAGEAARRDVPADVVAATLGPRLLRALRLRARAGRARGGWCRCSSRWRSSRPLLARDLRTRGERTRGSRSWTLASGGRPVCPRPSRCRPRATAPEPPRGARGAASRRSPDPAPLDRDRRARHDRRHDRRPRRFDRLRPLCARSTSRRSTSTTSRPPPPSRSSARGILAAFPVSGFLVARASGVPTLLEPALSAGLAIVAALVLLGLAAPIAMVFALAFSPIALGSRLRGGLGGADAR